MEPTKKQTSPKTVSNQTRQNGFTLVEVLVVVAVMLLLISILLPTLSKAKERARQVVCRSNLRQQGTMMIAYASDHDQRYPVAPRYYPFGGLINWKNNTCWMRTYQPAGQMALHANGYADDPTVFYCPSAKTGKASYITQEEHWDKPAQLHPESNRFFLRCYKTYVTYATWTGFGYDVDGEPVISRIQPKHEEMELLQKRAAKDGMSRGDTILLSDIIQESMGSDAPKLNNHSRHENPIGGNAQYNDGSVQWIQFEDTQTSVSLPTISSCFRL